MAKGRSDWDEKVDFMRRAQAVHAEWDAAGGLMKLTLAPQVPVMPAPGPRPVGDLAKALEQRRRERHDVMFAATSVRPRLEPKETPQSVVPRAVRAREDARRVREAAAK